MMSTGTGETDQILNLKDLFTDSEIKNEINSEFDDLKEKNKNDNFNLLEEIQTILKKCAHLNPKQKLMYCESQRYFMKLYLREVNKNKL
ncbi:MAG: hypothetical protein ACFFEO_12675 [Candidatus Thorarchaeota archaeon]